MTEDLKDTLAGLDAGCRAAAERLIAAREIPASRRVLSPGFRGEWLVAASLAAALGIAVLYAARPSADHVSYPAAAPAVCPGNEYLLAQTGGDDAIREIIRTQGADGGWKTEFLTKRNAAALEGCGRREARVAYRKAMRYLRSRGAL